MNMHCLGAIANVTAWIRDVLPRRSSRTTRLIAIAAMHTSILIKQSTRFTVQFRQRHKWGVWALLISHWKHRFPQGGSSTIDGTLREDMTKTRRNAIEQESRLNREKLVLLWLLRRKHSKTDGFGDKTLQPRKELLMKEQRLIVTKQLAPASTVVELGITTRALKRSPKVRQSLTRNKRVVPSTKTSVRSLRCTRFGLT